jgi:ketosteroid isomerase-like protein
MADTAETLALIDRHWRAVTSGDLAAVMADYAEDAVLITGATGISKGRAAIGELLALYTSSIIPAASTRFVLAQTYAEGPLGFIVWSAESPAYNIKFASDTFVVLNERIVHQTSAGMAEGR